MALYFTSCRTRLQTPTLNQRFTGASSSSTLSETKTPTPAKPGQLSRYDYEYSRKAVYNIFIAAEPLVGNRLVSVTSQRTKKGWAKFLDAIECQYRYAEKIILVMDNLNTYKPGSIYETFKSEKARALLDRFEFVYTPKHGSYLNIAEIELRVLFVPMP